MSEPQSDRRDVDGVARAVGASRRCDGYGKFHVTGITWTAGLCGRPGCFPCRGCRGCRFRPHNPGRLSAGVVEPFEEILICRPVGQGQLGGERLVGALDGFAFRFRVRAGVDLGCGHVGVAEEVADVDQVDSGLEQVHRPGPSDHVRGDVHADRIARVAAAQGLDVPGEDLGDAPAGQSGLVGTVEQWVCVYADAGMAGAPVEVVLQQSGCGVHQRDPPGLGAFAVQRDQHRAGRSDVGGVQVADLLDAGGRVVEGGEQDGVAQAAPGGWVWFGQEGFDLVAGEVAHVDGRGLLLLDGEDLGGLVEELWPFDRGVPDKRFDDGEALVAGRRRVAAFGFEPVQEARARCSRSRSERRSFSGGDAVLVAEPGEQQFDGVSIGGDGLGGQVPLAGQVVGEEFRQPLAGQVPAGLG